MKKMAASLLALALLAPTISAAPAPDRAKQMLEAMKKKLPEVVKDWGHADGSNVSGGYEQAQVRLCRQISPTEAKVTIALLNSFNRDLPLRPLTIYLRYYDGSWTSTRFEAPATEGGGIIAIHRLMLAIDELGEK